MTTMETRTRRSLLLATMTLAAAACQPVIPAGKYHVMRETTASVLATSGGAYDSLAALQQQRIVYQAATGGSNITAETYRPGRGDKNDVAGRMRARRAALEALANYFATLDAFATRDFEGEVDAASNDLAGSVRTLAAHGSDDAEATQISSVLGTVVDVVGREVVKRKRRDGLKRIMTTAQRPVEETCRYVSSGNELAGFATDVLISNILAHARRLRPGALVARLPVDEAVGRAVHDADATREGLKAVNAAMAQLPQAHAAVLRSLDDPGSPVDALEQVVAETKRAKEFHDALSK
jgi:hypothetical protein